MCAAVEAKREEYWDNRSYELFWIVNSQPNFGRRRRPVIHPGRINPYRRQRRSGIRLNTANRAAEAALDAWAERSAGRTQTN